jgi:diadenosine tetraphosphate (Ap4A) HIT family hydrolase
MKTITLNLEDEMFARVAAIAKQAGIAEQDTPEWAAEQIRKNLSELLPSGPSKWMPREQWEALVRGENCVHCAQLAKNEAFDGYGFVVADLNVARLSLTKNQYIHGECVFTYKRHVKELHDLSQKEQYVFIDDLTRSARAIEKVFTPLKMSIDMGSSAYPHLYCRLKPRYYGDAAPEQRMSHAAERLLDPLEYEKYVTELRAALAQ